LPQEGAREAKTILKLIRNGITIGAKLEVSARACSWFANFFEKTFVNRVNRRMDIRMDRFCRLVWLVET
jgi:hypothetical protein